MFKKYLFNCFSERSIIFIEGEETPNPTTKGGINMKMTNDDFVRIVKDQCESIARVLERHAEEVTCKKEMESYRSMAQGKLRGVIDTAICVYACELGGNDEEYWTKVHEIRSYEDEIDSKITKIFLSWYDKYLNKFNED